MSKNFSLNQLTEGIRDRDVGAEGQKLISKWSRTGLLRGLNEHKRETMSRLLENQAAQVLREANQLSTGNIDGFSNIAFPIVRRVFGGLVANELVSIQPMSLPSGLLFYLDYSYGSDVGGFDVLTGTPDASASATEAATFRKGDSLYGSPNGRSVRGGADAIGGQYDLAGSTYSLVHSGTNLVAGDLPDNDAGLGAYNTSNTFTTGENTGEVINVTASKNLKLLQYDPQIVQDITENSTDYQFMFVKFSVNTIPLDKSNAKGISLIADDGALTAEAGFTKVASTIQQGNSFNVRRLNQIGTWDGSTWTPDAQDGEYLLMVVRGKATTAAAENHAALFSLTYPKEQALTVNDTAGGDEGSTLVIPTFESDFGSTPQPIIPEIDIKIESIAVTAQTRKLRARWSPELAQDLNAYHSLDAEVELTQILSEQIALEIDREILNDLLVEAKGANYYWSRAPGKFVNKRSGAAQDLASSLATGPQFTGTVREWYETLVETIIDVANEIHRKTLRGSANFIVVSPEVATIFEASVLYKPAIKIDGDGQVGAPFSLGAEAIGSLSNRFTVYKDPYFPRNKVLVGYKGGSYLETGYVYAPYVPLIVTPTIFAPEDFTPRKGVMTRYGKKMVRADFYGTVTCLDMDVI